MTELFFKYKHTPYLFDTRQFKLFQLKNGYKTEIDNQETRRKIRLDAIEINRDHALRMANT